MLRWISLQGKKLWPGMPGQHVIHLVMMVSHVVGHCWPCIVTWQQMVWGQLLMRRPLPRYAVFLAVIILCLSHCFRHLIISKKRWAKLVNVGDTSISWDNLNLTLKKTSGVLLQWQELLKIWSALLSNWPSHHILTISLPLNPFPSIPLPFNPPSP